MILPATVGVMVNVWAVDEFENVLVTAESPVEPVPVGVMVMVPVYELFGVMVKLVEALLALPDDGPVKVKVVAVDAAGTTALEAIEATDVPAVFVAFTVKVYEVPLVKPVME